MSSQVVSRQFRRFAARLKRLRGLLISPGAPVAVARAPGRIDVMGGVSDYSGGTVLEGTISEAVVAGVQRRRDDLLVAHSMQAESHGWTTPVSISLSELYSGRRLASYARIAALFSGSSRWAAYVLGAFHVLLREGVVQRWPSGATVIIDSDVPMGAGVASSGALEVAAMAAILAAFGIELEPVRMAILCQTVENRVAGAPCGVMDQVTALLGEPYKLLALLCQPCQPLALHALPADVRTFGIDTGVKHAVGGSRYTRARVATFMGLRIIAAHQRGEAYDGYLCNITPQEFRQKYWDLLPSRISGREFLRRWGETDDPVTNVDPDEAYSVRGCTAYPIYENARVGKFIEYLARARETGDERHLVRAGKLMYASHWGYRTLLALGARETDLIMRLVRRLGPERGLYGAKTSGGGSGGTMAILARADAEEAVREVAAEYAELTGRQPYVFAGSSPGTVMSGIRTLRA